MPKDTTTPGSSERPAVDRAAINQQNAAHRTTVIRLEDLQEIARLGADANSRHQAVNAQERIAVGRRSHVERSHGPSRWPSHPAHEPALRYRAHSERDLRRVIEELQRLAAFAQTNPTSPQPQPPVSKCTSMSQAPPANCETNPTRPLACGTLKGVTARPPVRATLLCCLAWLLGALLVMASLDRIPDPAATSPKAQSVAVSLHEHSMDAAASRILVAPPPELRLPARTPASVEISPVRQSTVLIDHAADPSPPLA